LLGRRLPLPGPLEQPMTSTVNIHEAKTHLSRLVERAAKGHEFVIAKAGKPMVRVVPIEPPPATRRLGLLDGKGTMTLDVKKDFEAEIEAMFYGDR
jgi:prevent-host-death family protein